MKNPFILYIDDDPDDRELLREVLTDLDKSCRVTEATNGEEGFAILEKMPVNDRPHLIVLDLNMPRLNGRDTLQQLQKSPMYAGIPIVIFSTSTQERDNVYFTQRNVVYLSKPRYHQEWFSIAATLLSLCRADTVKGSGVHCSRNV
jgi:CheY-like chemotaxis protein